MIGLRGLVIDDDRKSETETKKCVAWNLTGYSLCRRPPLSGRGLCGGCYVVLAHLEMCGSMFAAGGLFFYSSFTYSSRFGRRYCYFGHPKPIIWEAWCLNFIALGAILSAWGHLRESWEQTRGRPEPDDGKHSLSVWSCSWKA